MCNSDKIISEEIMRELFQTFHPENIFILIRNVLAFYKENCKGKPDKLHQTQVYKDKLYRPTTIVYIRDDTIYLFVNILNLFLGHTVNENKSPPIVAIQTGLWTHMGSIMDSFKNSHNPEQTN